MFLRAAAFVSTPLPSTRRTRYRAKCVCRADFSLSVYLVTDRRKNPNMSLTKIVEEAVKGGVTMVQLRDKQTPYWTSMKDGKLLRDITSEHNATFIVNDSIRLARDLHADGVHLGQDDASVAEARKALGQDAIIGVSAGNLEEAENALSWGADYLGVGDVFGTKTKANAGEAIGVEGLQSVVEFVGGRVPIVAIGGVGPENAQLCRDAGAQGVAIVSAVMKSKQPSKVAAELRRIMQ